MINKGEELKQKSDKCVLAFRRRLRELRAENKYSQDKLSEALDIARQTLAKYEMDKSASLPDIKTLCMLCEIFNVSPNYFLGYSDFASDNKQSYGLSPQTINLLQFNPNIHRFFDYFVDQMVKNDLEQAVSQIGIVNNVEKAWERVFPKDVIKAIDNAYNHMIKNAAFSADINPTEMERHLRDCFPAPKSFSLYYKEKLNQDAKNFLLQDAPNFPKLSDKEQYDCFIKILSNNFVEIKSIQFVYFTTHKRISNQIMEIINDYVKSIHLKDI